MVERAARIAANVREVRERIQAAAQQAGRAADSVRLVAVTKYVGSDDIRAILAAGVRDLGESRPQTLVEKAQTLSDESIVWHLIGPWQTNKVKLALPCVGWLHAGDRLRLLEAVDAALPAARPPLDVLLEVNISGDATKHGFAPEQLEPLLPKLVQLRGIRVRGLMAMSGLESDSDQVRREFTAVRVLRDRLAGVSPPELSWDQLSMGMSGDFEAAIAEGATMVRVGSALFEGLDA